MTKFEFDEKYKALMDEMLEQQLIFKAAQARWYEIIDEIHKLEDSYYTSQEEIKRNSSIEPLPEWPEVNGILNIPRNRFVVGQYVFAEWDEKPNIIHRVSEDSYMIMRGSVPQWLSFEDALSSLEASEKHPEYAYLYRSKS